MTSQNINSIRSLRFSTAFQYPIDTSAKAKEKMAKHLWWQPPDDAATWPAACMVLSSMNLEHLSVMIGFWVQWPKYTDIDDNVERSMLNVLQPLTGITASRYNVVLSTEVPEEVLSQLGPLPFTLGKDDTLTLVSCMAYITQCDHLSELPYFDYHRRRTPVSSDRCSLIMVVNPSKTGEEAGHMTGLSSR